VEFPELNVVEENEKDCKKYNEWIRILKNMEDEMNINNLEDGNNWDQVIQHFDWIDDAKNLYDRWNVYILANIGDDNYFQYKSKTEEYLAMIFAEWIKINVVSGINLPPDILDAIAGARRK
ncbi:24181_t:CDS:2, partial [Racocetra persica]